MMVVEEDGDYLYGFPERPLFLFRKCVRVVGPVL